MLDKIKDRFLASNLQFLSVDHNNKVLQSDDVIFQVEKGVYLSEIHPFFLPFENLLEHKNKEYRFSCVHLPFNNTGLICDIVLQTGKNEEPATVTIQNLSEHYNAYQKLAQKRNSSIINEELLAIKNFQLEERERFKNQFIANFSHELRNPLTSLLAFVNILKKTKLNSEQQEYLKLIIQATQDLNLMLTDVLSISKIEAGRFMVSSIPFNLKEMALGFQKSYKLRASEAGLKMLLNFDDEIPQIVEGDKLKLNQVLTNLLENALRFTDEGSITLDIALNQIRANRCSLRFKVTDTGKGIPEENQERIFESFTKISNDDSHRSTGLGLTIVSRLLELMGSSIKLESAPNQGSNFYFDLTLQFPLRERAFIEKKKTATGIELLNDKAKEKYSLLLVDENEMNQMIIFKYLIDTKKFYLDIESSSEGVLEKIVDKPYDLILMDVHLTGIEGHLLTRMIRELPFREIKKIPIIGLTSSTRSQDLKLYKKYGMNEVIIKPYDENELLSKIIGLLK